MDVSVPSSSGIGLKPVSRILNRTGRWIVSVPSSSGIGLKLDVFDELAEDYRVSVPSSSGIGLKLASRGAGIRMSLSGFQSPPHRGSV